MSKQRVQPPANLADALRSLFVGDLEYFAERLARIEAQQAAILAALQGHPVTAPSAEQWIDVRTACAKTSLGTTKIHELIADGTLASTKVGGRRLIASSSLEALMRGPAS